MTKQALNRSSELLTKYLADSEVRCPACRYSLRGCTSDRCPECGRELALRIVADGASRSTWWIAAIYGVDVAALLSILILASLMDRVISVLKDPNIPAMVTAGFAPQSDLPQWSSIFIVIAINGVVGLILALLIRKRDAFARLNAYQQAALGAACWLTPAIMLGILNLLTR